ncbi:hypothetical protein AMTRI_Chr03g141800 [Amborella trichopoda]
MIVQLTASTPITFSDDNILPDTDRYHNRALYITVHMGGHGIPRVLIDNGATLNICPVRTLERICIDLDYLEPSQLTIIAYDGSKRQAEGTMPIALSVRPISQTVRFYVSDIDSSFMLLLEWPWLHENLAIASILHQCLKFLFD